MLINLLCADFNLDDPLMYILYAIVLVFIVALAVFYLVSSLMRAKKLGMDMLKIKKVITSSISFSILPAIGIALGIVTLVGSLGVAFPAIRLSVIGSLQYETQMADGAANAITGSLKGLEILMLWRVPYSFWYSIAVFSRRWECYSPNPRAEEQRKAE